MRNRPIGIFDSGVGGLTVLAQLIDAFPSESFIYFGDNERAPYGNKTIPELMQINKEIIQFLDAQDIKLLVMACNTSCATVLDTLSPYITTPITGLITPAVRAAALATRNQKIVVLATFNTVRSHFYQKSLLAADGRFTVTEIACPEWVPLVESNQLNSPQAKQSADYYAQQVRESGADTVIYGCSHFPYFHPLLSSELPNDIVFVDPARAIVPEVRSKLESQPEMTPEAQKIEFVVSGDVSSFERTVLQVLPHHQYTIRRHSFLNSSPYTPSTLKQEQ